MYIVEERAYRILEGGVGYLERVRRVLARGGPGLPFNIGDENGTTRSFFTPTGEIDETDEIAVVKGEEFGSGISMEMVIFKQETFQHLGSVLLT